VNILGKKGQYTTRISRALSLINETKIFFHEMGNGKTIDQIHRMALEDNIFDKTSLESRKKVFSVIKNRFVVNPEVDYKILQEIINSNLNDGIKHFIIYYYFCKSEFVVYDITTKLLYNMFLGGKSIVTKNDVHTFFEKQSKNREEIGKWNESTRVHIVQHYLAIMKDFGFLHGSLKKQFNIPFIPTEVILFILFEKLDKKMNAKRILNSDDFKLFFLEKDELIHYFEEGARMGYIRFNYTKDIYDMDNMGMTQEEYVGAITGKV